MATSSRSWPRPAEPQQTVVAAAAAALVLFIGAWALIHHGFWRHRPIVDTPVYRGYGNAVAAGLVPYRDFDLEYPPGALPAFVLPSLGQAPANYAEYKTPFETEMWICGAFALLFMAAAFVSLRASLRRSGPALLFAALTPLALGSLVLSRYDLWPAAICTGALAALLAGRQRLGLSGLGLGVATKVWPGVIAPLALVWVWRRCGRRETLVCLAIFAATIAAVFLPFVVLAPDGVWGSLERQASRPLQLESLGSAVLLAAHHVGGLAVTMRSSHGSQNLVGPGPDAIGAASTGLQLGVLVVIWGFYALGDASRERLVRYAAASVCAFVALGKVLSPQFLVWLLPLVPLVRGRRGVGATALLGMACVLTQLWFPSRYWSLALSFAAFPSWTLLARDLVLVALLAVLLWPERATAAV